MKLDMKSKKNKANSHRGRGKEIAYPDTSDGQKGTLLSMNVSDISNALKAGGIGKRSTAPENPADWTMRANLIPRSIVGLNRDRAIKYLLTYVLIGVLIVSLVVSVFMFAQSTWAQLAQRIYDLLDELRADESKTYLLVAHNGIARVVRSYFYDMTNEEYAAFGIRNCEFVEYTFA